MAVQSVAETGQVYKGKDEIVLSHLILEPQHSILTQSYDCRLRLVGHSLLVPCLVTAILFFRLATPAITYRPPQHRL